MNNWNSIEVFLALVRAGLWEREVRLASYGEIDWDVLYNLAAEQSVLGLVAAGLESVTDQTIPQNVSLSLAGAVLQIEQRNLSMNLFIERLFAELYKNGISAILVKGQGIAQCYKRPLWRASGDIDLLFCEDNYQKAFNQLAPEASRIDEEESYKKHRAISLCNWEVELHGSLRSGLWKEIDRELDEIQLEICLKGAVRPWMNGKTEFFLPRADEDIVFIFSHILKHFFKEGIGLRQFCDWCRLIWMYKDSIDVKLLERRLRNMKAMTEWKVFASLAVDHLGMPEDTMPFYPHEKHWKTKAMRVFSFIMETGNFGHNRDYSYYKKYPKLVYKFISLWRHTSDGLRYSLIFPLDSLKVWKNRVREGLKELRNV